MKPFLFHYIKSLDAFDLTNLDPGEEVSLFTRWRENKDEAARQRLIGSQLRLVLALAKRYQTWSYPLEDMIGIGNCSLMTVVDKHYNYKRTGKSRGALSTLTTIVVRQKMIEVRAQPLVKVSTTKGGALYRKQHDQAYNIVSADGDSEAGELILQITDKQQLDENVINKIMTEQQMTATWEALAKVRPEWAMLFRYKLQGKRLDEIGEIFGLSSERIRQLVRRTTDEITFYLEGNPLFTDLFTGLYQETIDEG